MSAVQILTVPEGDDGSRLDRWFKRLFPHIPHGRVEKLLRTGQLRVDGKRAKGNFRLTAGQAVRVPPLPDPTEEPREKPSLHSDEQRLIRDMIIFENEDLIALNKPAGLAVQGGSKTSNHIDRLLPALGDGVRLVHRLDRDTSGVLVVAKSAASAKMLGSAFASRKARKIYWGITNGLPRPMEGEIKGYIAKGIRDNSFGNHMAGQEIMVAVRHGAEGAKYARTQYQVVAKAGTKAAWVVMQPQTGRTHQLRLHMQLLGAPLAGDPKYLTDRPLPTSLDEQLHLHARELTLPLSNGKSLTFIAPLPAHIQHAFDIFGFDPKMPIPEMEPVS
ncbi:RluA family pseudouridine synthase [Robiginitomaculum antarcticum]|uniref:RluA family pseudouridine synthase n=1 Tax=Robiginitomaculum antarcticum TaxID=437507 RepID=UPI0003611B6D|nr:RluA family pseudouridine synthase [Robiginitomaculum antarcticum]